MKEENSIERQKYQLDKTNNDNLLKKFEDMINTTKTASMSDLTRLSENFLSIVKELRKELTDSISNNKENTTKDVDTVNTSLKKMEVTLRDIINSVENKSFEDIQNVIQSVKDESVKINNLLSKINVTQTDIRLLRDNISMFSVQSDKVKKEIEDKINASVVSLESKMLKEETGETLVSKIQEVKRPWLSIEAIDGDFNTKVTKQFGGGNTRPLDLLVNNNNYGGIREINFVGSGISAEVINGVMTVSFSGSGFTKETPSGAVNSVNKTFTVTNEPNYVVSDGVTYFDGAGYTYSALSITMDVPPSSFIRSYY